MLPPIIHTLKSVKTAYKGQILFHQGDAAHHFWIVETGWVKLFRVSGDGKETVIGLCTTEETFGETAILKDHTYPYSAEAVSALTYGIIPQRTLHEAMAQHVPDLCMTLMTSLESKMQQHERLLDQNNTFSATQRLSCFFIRLCYFSKKDDDKHLNLPLDKHVLAASLSMQPETFSRALKELQDLGVTLQGEHVTINDIDALQHSVCDACSELGSCSKTPRY